MWWRFYPEGLRRIFVDRYSELERLESVKLQTMRENPENLAIIGLRKSGKTLLTKEFLYRNRKEDIDFTYMNLEEIMSSPELFSIKFIGKIAFWVFGGDQNEKEFLNLDMLSQKALEIKSNALLDTLKSYRAIIDSRRIDYSSLIKLAFDFPNELARGGNRKIIVVLDEFQEVQYLSNYRGLENILGILRPYFEIPANVSYVILGSAVSFMNEILGEDSPLFMLFNEMNLRNFDRNATHLLVRRFFPGIPRDLSDLIFFYTGGNPFYIKNICEELKNRKISKTGVKEAFIFQTLSKSGNIYKYCNYLYKISLEKAKGYGNLKAVLQILAEEQGLTLTEISKRMRKPLPAIKDALESLIRVDIILERDKRYFFIDPVLRYWIAYFELGIEVDELPRERDLISLLKELDEKFQRVSSELGKAKEYEFKAKLEEKFGIKLENYLSEDDTIEFDLIGRKSKLWYIFEVKWRNRPATYKDLKKFLGNVKSSEFSKKPKKLFFISKSFTEKALKFARENDISILEE